MVTTEEGETLAAPSEPKQDEYAKLKHDLRRVAERGKDALDEATPGRAINAARFRMQSRHGTIVQTGADGIPQAQFCGRRKNRRGEEQVERFFIGLGCEALTRDTAYKSELISQRKRVVNEFEATQNTATLLKSTVEEAQKKGDAVQRKIDEEAYEYFPPVPSVPMEKSIVYQSDPTLVDTLGNLFSVIQEVIDRKLGAKLDKCEILAYHVYDCQTITAADGTCVDSVNPMLAINVQVKTKDGNTAFGAIRGAGGGLEILKRKHPERTYEEIVTGLAENIAKDAIDLDRAQGSGILGSECPVIFGSHAASVLIHEAYGHGVELDLVCENRRSKTARISLKGRIGSQVTDYPVTIIDDGNRDVDVGGSVYKYCWGSIPVDDHGQPPQRTILVEKGIQVGVLSGEAFMNEGLDGLKDEVADRIRKHGLSGNMRAEKFDVVPLVRMTNTCLLPDPKGPKTLAEMAALVPKTKKGVYIHRSDGGWVNTDTGDFVVKGSLCYLVENGIVTDKPIKNVTVSGNLSKFGNSIKSVGSVDSMGDHFSGMCGKGQWIPVDGIAPPVYCENAKLGGGSGFWGFDKILKDYIRQIEEKQQGKRDSVFIPEIQEISGATEHDNILMVCEALPFTEEVAWLTGRKDKADFVSENGELRDRKAVV